MQQRSEKFFEKLACSLIVCHMILILLAPLGPKLYQKIPFILRQYINQIGLNSSWTLYSPNPPVDRKIIVRRFNTNSKNNDLGETVFYTPKKRIYGLNSKRELTFLKYFFQRDRMKSEFWPMLCEHYNGGYWTIEVWHRVTNKFVKDFTKDYACDAD